MPTIPVEEPPDDASGHVTQSSPTTHVATAQSISDISFLRGSIRSLLADHHEDCVVDAQLIIDVLLTSAFDYGFIQHDVQLTIKKSPWWLIIQVETTEERAVIRYPPPNSIGAGRLLLERITDEWGVYRTHGYSTTWVTMDLGR